MRTRDSKGRYGPHNTPGDGTGREKLQESEAHEILTDVRDIVTPPIKQDQPWDESPVWRKYGGRG